MPATLVDSNVIIDLLEPGSLRAVWAKEQIAEAKLSGDIVFNIVVASEVSYEFRSVERYRQVFVSALWTFEDIPFDAGLIAGWAHREYRSRGGSREQTLPDFLIGAHAQVANHRLLTRDARRFRTYFPEVDIISPGAGQ